MVETQQCLQRDCNAVAGETEQWMDMPGGTQAVTAVLVAWLWSDLPDAAKKAHRGLRQMTDLAVSVAQVESSQRDAARFLVCVCSGN